MPSSESGVANVYVESEPPPELAVGAAESAAYTQAEASNAMLSAATNGRGRYQALRCLLYTSPSPRDRG